MTLQGLIVFVNIVTGESPLTYNCVMTRDSSIATVKAKLCDMLGIGVKLQLFDNPKQGELADHNTLASYDYRVVVHLELWIDPSAISVSVRGSVSV